MLSPTRLLSWGFFPFGVLVKKANLPCGFHTAVMSPSRVSHPTGLYFLLNRYSLVSCCNTFGIFPFSVCPFRGYVSRYRARSLLAVASLLASSLRRKKPTRWLDFKDLLPAQGRTTLSTEVVRRRYAPGVLPLSRFLPCAQMPKHNLHVLYTAILTS